MKRGIVLRVVITVVLMTSMGWAQTQTPPPQPPVQVVSPQVSPAPRPVPRALRQRNEPQRQLLGFQEELKKLEADHQALLNDLKSILDMAQQEKATQTVQRIEALKDKLVKDYEDKASSLQSRIDRLERIVNAVQRRNLRINRVGIQAPDFALKDLEGHDVKLSAFKGKIVVLEWFSPESAQVLYHYEKKTLKTIENKLAGKKVVWLGLTSSKQDRDDRLQWFIKRYKVNHPVLDDREGRVAQAYGVTHTPHVVIVDTTGKIAYTGAIDNDPKLGKLPKKERINYVAQALDELLAQKPVSMPQSDAYGSAIQ